MKKERIEINGIPTVIWGEKSKKVYIAVHGNMSNKEDDGIAILAEKVVSKGYQLLSFDLPEHGERIDKKEYLCRFKNCVKDLKSIIEYAKSLYDEINIWACSMGAYFSLVACKEEKICKALFLSPIVNMKFLIDNMMTGDITKEMLREKKIIKNDYGQTLYWDDYEFVENNLIEKWNADTYILYGDKDVLQEEKILKNFCNRFNCKLTVVENGEHYFHTKEQIDKYIDWLDEII